jgi:hypothetical protein
MMHTKRRVTLASPVAAHELGAVDSCTMSRNYCTAAAGRRRAVLTAQAALVPEEVGRETEHTHWGKKGLCSECKRSHLGTGFRQSWDKRNSRSRVER